LFVGGWSPAHLRQSLMRSAAAGPPRWVRFSSSGVLLWTLPPLSE
jgi:hypothetical protein